MKRRPSVAIVGIGCRLPGGITSPREFAQFLRGHGDAVVDVPADRWNADLHYDSEPRTPGKTNVRRGAFLSHDIFSFDPEPFGISPKEADQLDPQQRLLLEVTWEAFEDAGIAIDRLRGSDTAVYVGGFTLDHQSIAYLPSNRRLIGPHTSTGASMTLLSNRLSYTFDLRGPSLTIDTACSSSLVAAHVAFETISRGDCDLAVVGGVNVMLSPATFVAMSKGQFLASDGRSKTFSADADGYGRGEGAAVAILKPLPSALRDGDRVYAIILASGVNQDGKTPGIAMPNGEAQRSLSERVLRASGLRARDVAYVEAHGTGTRAGDLAETRALGAAYGRDRDIPLLVGSVKSNIGHLEAASGITGLIKAALSVQHREVFPLRALETPNPEIPFEDLGLRAAIEGEPWPVRGTARAAVNSFGYGGTNAHVILSEAPQGQSRGDETPADGPKLVPLSAANRHTLVAYAAQLAEAVDDADWANQAFTLARRRSHWPERATVVASSATELREELRRVAVEDFGGTRVAGRAPNERPLLWVFTGMGPQWWAMGQELYGVEPIFRAAVEEADRAFESFAGWSVLAEMLSAEPTSQMRSNRVAQPANFVLQVGLVTLLRHFGVPEDGILGHSVGEVAAAWASGCLSLEDAAFVACHRSRLQQTVAGNGTMLAVALSELELQRFLDGIDDVSIAAYNAPRSLTLAGARAGLEAVASRLSAESIFNRFVSVEIAYHSAQMDPLKRELRDVLQGVVPQAPRGTLYSTARGRRVIGAEHNAAYWWENARHPVLLFKALQEAAADGFATCLEVGPHPVLATAIREAIGQRGREPKTFFCLKRGQPEVATFQRMLGELYTSGVSLRWEQLHPRGRLSELPKYPFSRERHWTESDESRETRVGRSETGFSKREPGPTLRVVSDLARPSLSYLLEHRVQGLAVFPGAGYIDAALSACVEADESSVEVHLVDVAFERAFVLRTDAAPELRVEMDARDRGLFIYGRHDGQSWERHARARVLDAGAYDPLGCVDIASLEGGFDHALSVEDLYRRFERLGLAYGPEFRPLQAVRVRRSAGGSSSFLAQLRSSRARTSRACVDPPLIDGAFQAVLAAAGDLEAPMLPVYAERIRWFKREAVPVWAHGQVYPTNDSTLRADLTLLDHSGSVVLEVRGLVCREIGGARQDDVDEGSGLFHIDAWRPRPWPTLLLKDKLPWGLAGNAPWLKALERALRHRGVGVAWLEAAGGTTPKCARWVFATATDPSDPIGLRACDRLRIVLAGNRPNCPLRVVTFGAHRVADDDTPDPVQTAIAGFARVAMTEMPALSCRAVDLPASSEGAWPHVLTALADDRLDEEIAIRNGELHAHRITRASRADMAIAPRLVAARDYAGAYALERGTEEGNVRFSSRPRFDPGHDRVELSLLAISMDPYDAPVRLETSGASGSLLQARLRSMVGTVTRVGSGVGRVNVGDRVQVLQKTEVTSHVLADEKLLVPLANDRDPAQAVAYADYFMAWHALVNLARIEPGERVLVHDAGSPLGAACLEVAALFEAQVYATTANESDRSRLLSAGVERVYSSKTLDFVEALLGSTGGKGVHVVLNALPDPVCRANVDVLGANGRLVEMRPVTAVRGERPETGRLRKGGSVSILDLSAFAQTCNDHYMQLTRSVLSAFARGQLGRPRAELATASEIDQLATKGSEGPQHAHRVLDLSRGDASIDVASGRPLLRPDRTYLVTGGLAGLGVATAQWMVQQGARNLVLGSRRGRPDVDLEPIVDRMRRMGARVECLALDVANVQSVDAALDFIRRELPALAGIFHSAMVLDDGAIHSMSAEALERVMLPKAYGAWLLDQRTRGLPLDHFVLYSSVSALIGNPGQAAYAAANAFLEGIAARRRSEGLPATCVNWGAIDEIGVVSRDSATRTHLQRLGITAIPVRRALAALGHALRSAHFSLGIIDMRWDRWVANFAATPWNRLAEISDGRGDEAGIRPLKELRDSMATWDDARKRRHVAEIIRATAGHALGRKPDGLDDDVPLTTYGLDSLIAVELQAALERRVGLTVPTIQFVAGLSVAELSDRALEAVDGAGATAAPMLAALPPSNDLRAQFLSRICVQPPYFALFDCKHDDGWVEALVKPVPPGDTEDDVVSCAEAARHLAIVGSCAVSLRSRLDGRVYYPVRRASYVDVRGESGASATGADLIETARVRARCVEFDAKMSRATAETCLLDSDGRVLFKLMVDYHVVPEGEFERLFADRLERTNEGSGPDPYSVWNPPETREAGDEIVAELGAIDPASCVGHFVGYPALPVSIMTRHALHLVGQGVRKQAGATAQIAVVSGWVETNAFVFAREKATMVARCLRALPGQAENVWRCEVHCNGKVVVVFEFNVAVRERRVSEVRAVRPVGLTA